MSNIPFRPLNDIITILLDPTPSTALSSIIVVPDSALPRPETGTVVGVGPGKYNEKGVRQAPAVSVNDRVIVGKGSGQEIKVGGYQLLAIHEDDIMAVLG